MTVLLLMEEYTVITKNALIENTKIDFDLFLRIEFSSRHPKYIFLLCKWRIQF